MLCSILPFQQIRTPPSLGSVLAQIDGCTFAPLRSIRILFLFLQHRTVCSQLVVPNLVHVLQEIGVPFGPYAAPCYHMQHCHWHIRLIRRIAVMLARQPASASLEVINTHPRRCQARLACFGLLLPSSSVTHRRYRTTVSSWYHMDLSMHAPSGTVGLRMLTTLPFISRRRHS